MKNKNDCIQVSIIIVNYNTKALLKNCLDSIYEQTKEISFEIIVSDNGSTDGSIEMIKSEFPEVILIENNANLGFGAANNRGLDIAKGEYIFYLNSDTVLLNNAIKIFYDFWESSPNKDKIGALGTNLLNGDMRITHSGGDFPKIKLVLMEMFFKFAINFFLSILYILRIDGGKFRRLKSSETIKTGMIDFVTGADLFMKNNELAKFDENFFLYFEDNDLQFNLHKHKKYSYLITEPKIQHFCGGSVRESYSIKRKATFPHIQFELSRVRFAKKNNNSPVFVFLLKSIITLIWLNPFLITTTRKYFKSLWKL